MKRYRVELSPEALEHARTIRDWWIENRDRAPNLFVDELVRVLAVWHTSRGRGPM